MTMSTPEEHVRDSKYREDKRHDQDQKKHQEDRDEHRDERDSKHDKQKKSEKDKKKDDDKKTNEDQCPKDWEYVSKAKKGQQTIEACRMPQSYHLGTGFDHACVDCHYSYGRWLDQC